MKYTITPERALQLIEIILAPFEIRNKIDDSWQGKWWKLSSIAPQRTIIVWDKHGETVFTFDRMYNELVISEIHRQKILSYIPLPPNLLETLLIVLFKNLLGDKFPVERVDNYNLRIHDKEDLETDEDEN